MSRGLLSSLRGFPLLLSSADVTIESLGRMLNAWTQVIKEKMSPAGEKIHLTGQCYSIPLVLVSYIQSLILPLGIK